MPHRHPILTLASVLAAMACLSACAALGLGGAAPKADDRAPQSLSAPPADLRSAPVPGR